MSGDANADADGTDDRDPAAPDRIAACVRGIYATAGTRAFLAAGHDVVQASDPIRDRFGDALAREDGDDGAAADVTVDTTDDRQGVTVTGRPPAVDVAVDVLRVARDALAWRSPAPEGAVFDATVTGTRGGGAVCALGDAGEGYLPFDDADGYVDEGDAVRVQVAASAPPWADDRPRLTGGVRASTGLATLVAGGSGVRVDTYDDEAGRELVGMTDLLGIDVPDGWGLVWSHAATSAGMDALRAAADRAVERAATLEDLDDAIDPPRRLAAPSATTHVWFGRESRFALDDRRRAVVSTMPGHHRTKAAHEAASAGVDLVEALCPDLGGDGAGGEGADDGDDFPFGVVARQFGPHEGGTVRIEHGKPDGRLIVLGRADVTGVEADGTVELRREMTPGGTYDALGVEREAGDVAITTVREGRWWYPTTYRDADGGVKGTYVNVCTPAEAFPDAVRYVDLHVDVVRHADGTVERVDDDELDAAVAAGNVPESLAEKARSVAASLERAL